MVMTIEVDVEELCRKAVATTPIISPHRGFDNSGFFAKISPAARPLKYRNVSFSCFQIQIITTGEAECTIFTGVCHSVSEGVGVSVQGFSVWGVSVRRISVPKNNTPGQRAPSCISNGGHCVKQNVFYWNAFLLYKLKLVKHC